MKASETNESALKVSLILGGLHVTLYAAHVKQHSLCAKGKGQRLTLVL
jgi:hypothetical protein